MRYLTIFLLLFITGCVPKMNTVTPEIEGKVIDSVTKKPIEGVLVSSKLTDKNGYFDIKGKKELGIGTPMGGIWKIEGRGVRVSKKRVS